MKKIILSLLFLSSITIASDAALLQQKPWSDLLKIIMQPTVKSIEEIEDYIKTVEVENIPNNIKNAFLVVATEQKDKAIDNLRNKVCFNTASWKLFFSSWSSAKKLAWQTWNSVLQINSLIPYTLVVLAIASAKNKCEDIKITPAQIMQYGLNAIAAYLGGKAIVNLISFSSPEETLLAKNLAQASHILYVLQKHFKSQQV